MSVALSKFQTLCNHLKQEYPSVFPVIFCKNSTGYVAQIFRDPDHAAGAETRLVAYSIVSGQGDTIAEAMGNCVENFEAKTERLHRMGILILDPDVREALTLFGVKDPEAMLKI